MPTFTRDALEQFGQAVFEAAGAPAAIAGQVVRSLVSADLSGHPSHGVLRVPSYVDLIEAGDVDPTATPTILRQTPSTMLLSGNWGFGQIAAAEAVDQAAAMAKTAGIALVSVIDCNHVGRLGEWSERAAAADVIAIMTVGGGSDVVGAPFGGARPALSTNPISAGVPAGQRDPLVMDFATTMLAVGKIHVAKARGDALPAGAILDDQGQPSTSPSDFFDGGMLLPFGAHKGSALSVLIDALSSGLTGAEQSTRRWKLGATIIGIDPAIFRPRAEFGGAVDALFDRITSVPPAPGFAEVMLPGEPERRSRAERAKSGVEVSEATRRALLDTAGKLGVDAAAVSDSS